MREATTVTLSEMADRITFEFGIDPPIAATTPYDWWKRSKYGDITVSMPQPIRKVGTSYLFLWGDIKRWYAVYSGMGKVVEKMTEPRGAVKVKGEELGARGR